MFLLVSPSLYLLLFFVFSSPFHRADPNRDRIENKKWNLEDRRFVLLNIVFSVVVGRTQDKRNQNTAKQKTTIVCRRPESIVYIHIYPIG